LVIALAARFGPACGGDTADDDSSLDGAAGVGGSPDVTSEDAGVDAYDAEGPACEHHKYCRRERPLCGAVERGRRRPQSTLA